jgi:hypothetical protein
MVLLVEVQRVLVILHGFDLPSTDVSDTGTFESQKLDCTITYATYVYIQIILRYATYLGTSIQLLMTRLVNQSKCSYCIHYQMGNYYLVTTLNEFQINRTHELTRKSSHVSVFFRANDGGNNLPTDVAGARRTYTQITRD